MLDRRLLMFLDKDDIPSTARVASAGLKFNVIYFPPFTESEMSATPPSRNGQYLGLDEPVKFKLFSNINTTPIKFNKNFISIYESSTKNKSSFYLLGGFQKNSSYISAVYGVNASKYIGYLKFRISDTYSDDGSTSLYESTVSSVTNDSAYPIYIDTEPYE